MKKKKYIFLILFLGLFLLLFPKLKLVYKFYINPCFNDKPVKQNDFPQHFLEVDLNNYYQKISSFNEVNFTVDTLETISFEEKKYPILSISNRKKEVLKSKKILILAGVHGNESAGLFSVLELLQHLNFNPTLYQDWQINIVTPVNPVGVEKMSRYNECGCDLNRKITSSQQKGIELQRQLVNSFQPTIIVSLHEAPSDGFLIHTNELVKSAMIGKILNSVENKGIELSSKDYFGRDLEIKGNSKISGVLKLFNRLFNVDALGDYITPKGIAEITTESGWNTEDQFQRVQSHVFLIESVLENFEVAEK